MAQGNLLGERDSKASGSVRKESKQRVGAGKIRVRLQFLKLRSGDSFLNALETEV